MVRHECAVVDPGNPVRGSSLPDAGEQVELSLGSDTSYTTWVDQADGDWLSVFTPHDVLIGDIPAVGTVVTLRWHSARGRHHVDAELLGTSTDGGLQWEVEVISDVGITQDREYVRGAGGESVQLWRLPVDGQPVPDAAQVEDPPTEPEDPERALIPADGIVVDLSERGVRARFREVALLPHDPVGVRLVLDGDPVEVDGHVLRVIDDQPDKRTDVVVVYEPYENVAAHIRRYVLQAQLRARQLAAR